MVIFPNCLLSDCVTAPPTPFAYLRLSDICQNGSCSFNCMSTFGRACRGTRAFRQQCRSGHTTHCIALHVRANQCSVKSGGRALNPRGEGERFTCKLTLAPRTWTICPESSPGFFGNLAIICMLCDWATFPPCIFSITNEC